MQIEMLENYGGVDFSHKQLENAKRYLSENGYMANFICSPMEADMDIPKEYFDFVYSIYGIGWTTDLDGTFQKIASYLKKRWYLHFHLASSSQLLHCLVLR